VRFTNRRQDRTGLETVWRRGSELLGSVWWTKFRFVWGLPLR